MKITTLIVFLILGTSSFAQSSYKTEQPVLDMNNSLVSIIYDLSTVNKFKLAEGSVNVQNQDEIYYPYNLFGADYTYFRNETFIVSENQFKTDSNTKGYIVANFFVNPMGTLTKANMYDNLELNLKNCEVFKKYFIGDSTDPAIFKQNLPFDFNNSKSLSEDQKKEMNEGFVNWFNTYEVVLKLEKRIRNVENPMSLGNFIQVEVVNLTAWLQLKKPNFPNNIAGIQFKNLKHLEYSNSITSTKLIERINENKGVEMFNYDLGFNPWDVVDISNYYTNSGVLVHNKTKCDITKEQIENATDITYNLYEIGENTFCFDKNTAGIFFGKKLFNLLESSSNKSFSNFILDEKLGTYNYYVNVNGKSSEIAINAKTIKITIARSISNLAPIEQLLITYVNNPEFSLILNVEINTEYYNGKEGEILYRLINVTSK